MYEEANWEETGSIEPSGRGGVSTGRTGRRRDRNLYSLSVRA